MDKTKFFGILTVFLVLSIGITSAYSEEIVLRSYERTKLIPSVILSKIFSSFIIFYNPENPNTKNQTYQAFPACDSTTESQVRYNFTGHYHAGCNSTAWVRL